MRGDYVDIPLVRGDCGSCDWYPSKCRGDCWSVGWGPNPSSERLIVVWLSAQPSKCRDDSCCALPLSVEVVFIGERSCVLPVVFTQILVEVPCVGSPVWTSWHLKVIGYKVYLAITKES